MKNRIKAISLFSNVGVAETYLEEIGIDVVVANEIDEKRAEFYQHLYKNTKMICGDVTKEQTQKEILNEASKYKIDMVIATPPCQGMSIAGKRDPLDVRNQLIYFAVEIIKKIKPKYVFLENVPQTLTTSIKVDGELMLIPDYLKKELSNYIFADQSLVSAQDYGVPQMRRRNIFLLTRKDCEHVWQMPKPQKHITLKEAIGDLPEVDPILKEGMEETLKLFPDFEKKKKHTNNEVNNYINALTMLADKGDFEARNYIGTMYYSGRIVPQDFSRAKELYLKASKEGSTQALINLGYIYYYARCGGEPNYEQAFNCFSKASKSFFSLAF